MKSSTTRYILPMLLWGIAAFGQSPEAGRVERSGNQSILIVDSPRPVDSAAITLAQHFGIRLNVEDPRYVFGDDIKDLTATVSRDMKRTVLIPKGGHLEVRFAVLPDGSPADVPSLVQSLADAANAQFPFGYRIEREGDWFSLVPQQSRDSLGRTIPVTPLLDRRVTISLGLRSIAASAQMMADTLSTQTGLRVSCCQTVVAGIPWGMAEVLFEAHDEPARKVLQRLIELSAVHQQPNHYYWLQRCDPLPSSWCFINLAYTSNP